MYVYLTLCKKKKKKKRKKEGTEMWYSTGLFVHLYNPNLKIIKLLESFYI